MEGTFHGSLLNYCCTLRSYVFRSVRYSDFRPGSLCPSMTAWAGDDLTTL